MPTIEQKTTIEDEKVELDEWMVEALEATAQKALNAYESIKLKQQTDLNLDRVCDAYRPLATEATLIYLLIQKLQEVHPLYRYT